MSSKGKNEIVFNNSKSTINENNLSSNKKSENFNSVENSKNPDSNTSFPISKLVIKREINNTASTRLSHYLPHNIVHSLSPSHDREKSRVYLNQENEREESKKKYENTQEEKEKIETDSKENKEDNKQEEPKKLIRAIIKPVTYRNSNQTPLPESISERIIVVQSPIYTPVAIRKMKQVRIVERPVPTIVKRLPPEMIKQKGPNTLSLIRTAPKLKPIQVISNPQRILINPIQNRVQIQPTPILTSSLPPPFFPSYPPNYQQTSLPNMQNIVLHTLPQSYPHPFYRNFPQISPMSTYPYPNQFNYQNSFTNQNDNPSQEINRKKEIQSKETKIETKNTEISEREPSPIILFHDHDDQEKIVDKAGYQGLTDDYQNESENRQENKSQIGRNKLDFIANLFDGYYYTNIDYKNNNEYRQNDIENNSIVQETIEPFIHKNNRVNSMNRKQSHSVENTLPKIKYNSETHLTGNQTKSNLNRKPVSNYNSKQEELESIYLNQNRKNGSKSKLDRNEILPTPTRKKNDTESKLNYPRNSLLAK